MDHPEVWSFFLLNHVTCVSLEAESQRVGAAPHFIAGKDEAQRWGGGQPSAPAS